MDETTVMVSINVHLSRTALDSARHIFHDSTQRSIHSCITFYLDYSCSYHMAYADGSDNLRPMPQIAHVHEEVIALPG